MKNNLHGIVWRSFLRKLRLSCPCQPDPLQGDVIGLLDSTGTQVVKYTYNAWGKPTSKSGTMKNTLGTVQPFRYRGYVVDEETGLYYLRSRCYNPTRCRFVNADCKLVSGNMFRFLNLFSYCSNAPVAKVDEEGTRELSIQFAQVYGQYAPCVQSENNLHHGESSQDTMLNGRLQQRMIQREAIL